MATSTRARARKVPTEAQTDKVLKAIDLRYAVTKMADRYAQTSHKRATTEVSPDFHEAAYLRLSRQENRQRRALQRLLDAGLTAYKAEVYR